MREAMPASGSTITSWVSAPVWDTRSGARAGTVDGVVMIRIIAMPGYGYPFRHGSPFDGARPEVPGPIMPPTRHAGSHYAAHVGKRDTHD